MKKKKRTIFLVVLVLLIYVAVVARFFMLSEDSNDTAIMPQQLKAFVPEKLEIAAQFTIANAYRDPFLGTLPKGRQKYSTHSQRKTNSNSTPIAFPSIVYKGVVADVKEGKRFFAVEIEHKEYVITQGKTIEGIRVLSGDRKAISIVFKGVKKTYTRQ